MNLSALMNDGGAEEDQQKKQSPETQRHSQPAVSPVEARAPPASSYGSQPNLQTPFYPPPPSLGGARSAQIQGLTPLQTLSQAPGGGQYSFPLSSASAQSPAGGQQFRPYELNSATTPSGARPTSHGYQYAQPPPPPQHVAGIYAQPTSSLSPTPSSHHSQTPHSLRQSPLAMMQAPPLQHQYQHSQPSTPLGPPPPHFLRTNTHPDLHSPYHQRSYSGTSIGIVSGSPAQHRPIDNMIESPNAVFNRPSPQDRRTSQYLADTERERSLSVSPKTKVPPRPPSLGSRHSSQYDVHASNRSSSQTMAEQIAGSPNHVTPQQPLPPPQLGVTPLSFGLPPNPASEVVQTTPSSTHGVMLPNSYSASTSQLAEGAASLSQKANNQPPQPPQLLQHHSSQKMVMSHLLTPASEVPPAVNGSSAFGASPIPSADLLQKRQQQQPDIFMNVKRSVTPKPKQKVAPPQAQKVEPKVEEQVKPEMAPSPDYRATIKHEAINTVPSLKRSAEEAPMVQPPQKQRKINSRPYTQRPLWARLSRHNPKFTQQQPGMQNGVQSQQPQQYTAPQQQHTSPQPNGQPLANGTSLDSKDPWLHNPPLDMDLIHTRQIFATWEKTFRWNTPYPDMLRVVQDWLFTQLSQLGDVGTDPRYGTIEIEAKVGTLLQGGERCYLPVADMSVLRPGENEKFQFESRMDLAEHKAMNDSLNETIKKSRQPGRVHMQYEHLYETDSFHALSPLGLQALPQSLQRRRGKREPRLRITTDTKHKHIKARIVKIPINHLHIYNPQHNYDCRISINLEVNLDRADLDPDSLIADEDAQDSGKRQMEVPRIKDRLSYKHLAYSIDLTKVEREGLGATYELELEVDSTLLREQMRLLQEGEHNAFGDMVGGFLDNVTFLMREKVSQAG